MIRGFFAAVYAYFMHLVGVGKVIEKTVPDAEERKERLEIEKPLMEVEKRIEIEDAVFHRIKDIPGSDIAAAVRVYTDLNPQDEADIS